MSTFICEETTDRVVAIDLMEVPVVDRGAVKLLARSESNGAELRTARPISVDGSRERGEHEFVGARNRRQGRISRMLDSSDSLDRDSEGARLSADPAPPPGYIGPP